MTVNSIKIIPLHGIPIVSERDNIPSLILKSFQENRLIPEDGDILVIAHTLISKVEGRVVDGSTVSISDQAQKIADENNFEPVQVEIALRESKQVLRSKRALITQLQDGHICNFSGVDRSNAPQGHFVLLPLDADKSATSIRDALKESTGKDVAIIISDTEGRPWRKGAINLAIGCAGINAFKYNEGKKDLYGRILRHSLVCQIDQVASAAEMIMGQADEGLPVVVIRGYDYEVGNENSKSVRRSLDENLFR